MKQEVTISRQRERRRFRVRNHLKRHATRPRLTVFRSHKHVYAQVIDDDKSHTLVACSTRDKDVAGELRYGGNQDAAKKVGKLLAERALAAGIKEVAFDRREYRFHGRVKALAEAAREAGLSL
jgi:large subunit ribosomal protein L18